MSDRAGFVHLRVHSAYSLLEGAIHVKDLVKLAKADGQPAIAVTDHGNLFGALEFSEKAQEVGVQPIIAAMLAVEMDEALPLKRGQKDDGPPSLVMLAANADGYSNLVRLISRSFMETEPGQKARVTEAMLAEHADGLIVLSGSTGGPVERAVIAGLPEVADARLARLAALFPDRFYLELQRHGLAEEALCEDYLIDRAYARGLPLVATNQPYFAKREDYEAHDALICIAEGRYLVEEDRRHLTPEHYFKSRAEMRSLFSDLPEALDNTLEIARRCAVRSPRRKPILPRFAGAGADADAEAAEAAELRRQAEEGLTHRLATRGTSDGLTEEDYRKRLAFELNVIETMKFPGYFLIVSDFIKWAKAHGIPVGPGRGSGAGSLVAYSLTITDLDPMRFALLFERFLNPERVSMPDFDIDFCQDRREEVIHYVQGKYGYAQVAQIITFGSLQARAVLRDVGRVLQMPYGQVDRLSKMVPQNPSNPITLAKALETEPRLQEACQEPAVDRLVKMAMKLEGLFRHASTHAAGIVIGDRPLDRLVPIYRDPRSDMPVTQFNMKWVEQAGLVKFDFLGLKTLTVIEEAVRLIALKGIHIDAGALPLDDEKTYRMLARGETVGVFQLESQGMRKALLGMKADRFEDIVALVALYRPGPMDNIPTYNKCKHGLEEPDYLHPLLEPILKETFGVIIYQEQVMQIAQVLSGYSLGGADLLRRAMGKKIRAEMDKQRVVFVDGAVERGVDRDHANLIFDLVAKFADYGFNKSHAAAYALVAYQTAWLKANHPVEFLAASMTLDMGNTDKLNDFRREAIRLGFEVLPPSVNRSGATFDVSDGRILYALAAIKGVGRPMVDHLVERRGDKPFRDLGDFARRINPKQMNKRVLESLVAAGAFDDLEPDRARLTAGLDRVMAESQRASEGAVTGQSELFGGGAPQPIALPMVDPWLPDEKLQKEHAAVGFYLSAHPLDEYRPVFEKLRVQMWGDFVESVKRGAAAGRLVGTVTSRQERRTKTGNRMGIVRFSDPSGQYEAVLFSEALNQFRDKLEPGAAVVLLVGAEEREEGVSVRIQSVQSLEDEVKGLARAMRVFVDEAGAIDNLARHLERGDGSVSLVLRLAGGVREVEMRLPGRYRIGPPVASALRTVRGVADVALM
ncbi:DNA polymerase III subunit alpha, partial [Segnochrobactraceae bacterium EtOH-i3]